VLVNALPSLSSGTIPPIFRDKTLLEIAGMVPHLDKARLDSLEHALQGAVAAE
jgi:hypothetical protein